MREIVLDTETTGLKATGDDRLVEIGCIELLNHVPSGRTYQTYLNPQRDMPAEAFAVHGLSGDFLADKPRFSDVVDEFLGFIGDDPLIIHNAEFDLGFINAELRRLDRPTLGASRAVDTVRIARRKFPGAPASLDALCRRFDIDTTARSRHGALLDAGLLVEVYLELVGGRQPNFELAANAVVAAEEIVATDARQPRPHAPSDAEVDAHARFIDGLDDPIWRK